MTFIEEQDQWKQLRPDHGVILHHDDLPCSLTSSQWNTIKRVAKSRRESEVMVAVVKQVIFQKKQGNNFIKIPIPFPTLMGDYTHIISIDGEETIINSNSKEISKAFSRLTGETEP